MAHWDRSSQKSRHEKSHDSARMRRTAMAGFVATRCYSTRYLLGLNVPLHVPFCMAPLISTIQGVLFRGTGGEPDGCVAVGCGPGGCVGGGLPFAVWLTMEKSRA